MAKTAIALIIAGSGETTEKEVFDLLEDAYPLEGYEEVGLIAPVSKDLYTDTVKNVLTWYDSNDSVYAVRTKGSNLSRATSGIGGKEGAREVESFTEVLTSEEYAEEWDEFVFLVAMPGEDAEDAEYETYAEMVEFAIEHGVPVKNLCRGLDDVTLDEEPATPEPEPEPEPVKPQRKSRARKKVEEAPEPEPESQGDLDPDPTDPPWEKEPDLQEQVNEAAADAGKEAPTQDGRFVYHAPDENSIAMHSMVREACASVTELFESFAEPSRERSLAVTKIEEAMFWANAHIARNITPAESPESPSEPEEKPTSSRGRGRPRTNYEVKQILDDGEWIPRPKGRMRKGTEWRTIHAETSEILDEGTA